MDWTCASDENVGLIAARHGVAVMKEKSLVQKNVAASDIAAVVQENHRGADCPCRILYIGDSVRSNSGCFESDADEENVTTDRIALSLHPNNPARLLSAAIICIGLASS